LTGPLASGPVFFLPRRELKFLPPAADKFPARRFNRQLKKPFPGRFQPGNGNRGFPFPHIFNDLASLKMAVHPCTTHWLSKNFVFQQPVTLRPRALSARAGA
jgi:hypothetical protein